MNEEEHLHVGHLWQVGITVGFFCLLFGLFTGAWWMHEFALNHWRCTHGSTTINGSDLPKLPNTLQCEFPKDKRGNCVFVRRQSQ